MDSNSFILVALFLIACGVVCIVKIFGDIVNFGTCKGFKKLIALCLFFFIVAIICIIYAKSIP